MKKVYPSKKDRTQKVSRGGSRILNDRNRDELCMRAETHCIFLHQEHMLKVLCHVI